MFPENSAEPLPGVRVAALPFASDSVPEFVSVYLDHPCMYIPVCAVAA